MRLGEVQGGLEVQVWQQELVHQHGRLPELPRCLKLSAIHLVGTIGEHWLVAQADRFYCAPQENLRVGLAVAS